MNERKYFPTLGWATDSVVPQTIILPWPPSSLSGHAKGNWRGKHTPTAKHRQWAFTAAKGAKLQAPPSGDVRLHIHFQAPDNRSDRCNYWNRCKPYIDGIAEAMGINDRRFLPSMSFGPNVEGGRVTVMIGGNDDESRAS